MPAGVGLEAGPDGGVVAEPPRDQPAARGRDTGGDQEAGDDQPGGAPDAPASGGFGRGL